MADDNTPRGITFQPDIYPKVVSLLPPVPCRLLDVGAGEGYFAQRARQLGHHVEACDVAQSAFRVPDVPFHPADLNERIPVPDGSFDCAVAIEVIEHVENHTRFVRELLRIVRPGGSVIITTPNVLSIPARWHQLVYGYSDAARTPLDPAAQDYYLQHINPISLPELLFLTERFGGELVALETNRWRRSAVFFWPLLYPLLALLLRAKLLGARYQDRTALHRRHLRWMLHPANLLGRITVAVLRRTS